MQTPIWMFNFLGFRQRKERFFLAFDIICKAGHSYVATSNSEIIYNNLKNYSKTSNLDNGFLAYFAVQKLVLIWCKLNLVNQTIC